MPSVCRLCAADAVGILCRECAASLPLQRGHLCSQCDLPLPAGAHLCAECLRSPPAFTLVVSGYLYQFPIDLMIHDFKNRYHLAWLEVLATPLLERIRQCYAGSALPDVLVPVPLHWQRQLLRGYNQSQLVANYLTRELGVTSTRLVKKRRNTPAQKALNRKQRNQNLRGVFELEGGVQGRHIALIDDVVTTAATVRAISKMLMGAGARRVDIWVLARTPKPG